jgi:cyclopropane-fatty-acyl-phospholipid synthase
VNSWLTHAHVEHVRTKPKQHRFRYPVLYYVFDLDRLQDMDRSLPLFGYNRWRPSSLWDRDYLQQGNQPLREKVDAWLEEENLQDRVARVLLVTAPRHFGYVFNPVTFYFCMDADNGLVAVLTEVNNTFGDRYLYLLRDLQGDGTTRLAKATIGKAFHVSPFHTLDGHYKFSFGDLCEKLDVCLDLHQEGERIFQASIAGPLQPLTARDHCGALLRYPLRPWLTMPRILWEAFRLYCGKRLKVYTRPVPSGPKTLKIAPPTPWERFCQRQIEKLFGRIRTGGLRLTLWDESVLFFGDTQHPLQSCIEVRNPVFFSRLVTGGHIAVGESYVDNFWECDDPALFVELLIANRDHLKDGNLAAAFVSRLLARLIHLRRANTIKGSRQNIAAHYDLSNDFYGAFLDPGMTYSSAWFSHPDQSLEEAQRNKLQALIRKAQIGPEHHVLEIGCGWGSFAIEAVQITGCRVTGITLSREQLEFARTRVREAGLEDRIELHLSDYRHVQGAFDRIVSIEMLEAVGHRYFGSYFAALERLLKPAGIVALQVITVPDQRYDAYRKDCDWIQKYIFPGGLCPSLEVVTRSMRKHSRLTIEHLENIGPDYARTLRIWRENFERNWEQISALGFDKRFQRIWLYYLCYCEAGFASGTLGDLQLILSREGTRLS